MQTPRGFHRGLITRLFIALEVPLQFHVNIAAPESANHFFQRFVGRIGFQTASQRTFFTACEADQAFGKFCEFLGECSATLFSRPQFHARNQTTEILISLARFREQRITTAILRSHFRTDMRLHLVLLRGSV